MEKIGIYCRQSKEKEDSVSIPDQMQQGNKKAIELGLEFEVYNEGSGKQASFETLDNRPEMQRLLMDIAKGKITSVWVVDSSRLSRHEKTTADINMVFKKFKVISYYGSNTVI